LDGADHDRLGLIAAGMVFAKSDQSFSVVRLLLGAAEAGFFSRSDPGFRRTRVAR